MAVTYRDTHLEDTDKFPNLGDQRPYAWIRPFGIKQKMTAFYLKDGKIFQNFFRIIIRKNGVVIKNNIFRAVTGVPKAWEYKVLDTDNFYLRLDQLLLDLRRNYNETSSGSNKNFFGETLDLVLWAGIIAANQDWIWFAVENKYNFDADNYRIEITGNATTGDSGADGIGEDLTAIVYNPPVLEVFPFKARLSEDLYHTATVNPCDSIRFKVVAEDGDPPYSVSGLEISAISEEVLGDNLSQFAFNMPRQGANRTVNVSDSNNQTIALQMPLINKAQIVGVDIEYSEQYGATATIKATQDNVGLALNLRYGLAENDYYNSNIFPYLQPGNHTAYLTDNFGCVKQLSFTVEEAVELRGEPFFDVPIANPLRFINEDLESEFSTFDNRLMPNMQLTNVENLFFKQPFLVGHIAKTQIRSSYRDIEVNVIDDCTGDIVSTIIPELKRQNIGLKFSGGASLFLSENGEQTYIIFNVPIQFDPETLQPVGEYPVNGRIPFPAKIGDKLTIEPDIFSVYGRTTAKISDIIFFSGQMNHGIYPNQPLTNSYALVIEGALFSDAGFTAGSIVTCQYDAEKYDIYEFEISEIKGQYLAEISASDSADGYNTVNWKSEVFAFDDFENVVVIDYFGTTNQKNIDYSTGISFRIVLPANFLRYRSGGESDNLQDDRGNGYILKDIYKRLIELETSHIPMWLAEKLIIAVGHDEVYINGLPFTKLEEVELEDKIDENNPFYVAKCSFQQRQEITITQRNSLGSGSRFVLSAGDETILSVNPV
jgi:hypothetical protein